MPAYRFCRTDDIPLLVAALNACYGVHFRDQAPFTVDEFKREIRELSVWSSSCMVVSEAGEPIAVVTGAKREHETWVHRIGVHPDFQRQGHAQHMLESLSHKLSVLGPPKVVAEVPDDLPGAHELVQAVGYRAESRFADFSIGKPPSLRGSPRPVVEVGLEDLLRDGVLDLSASRSWERAVETLQNRKEQLQGLAIAPDGRVEAYVLFRDLPKHGRRELVSVGEANHHSRNHSDRGVLLARVVQVACQAGSLHVRVPRVSDSEMSWALLEELGFRKERSYTGYVELPGTRMH
jgi:ribosomal protein S18 acetylase RimI-like enzyme